MGQGPFRHSALGKEGNRKPIQVKNGKRSGKNVVVKLAGIDSRELAESVMGLQISVPRSSLPALSEEEVYWTDIIGCEVETSDGTRIGPAERMFDTGANDVMVVTDKRADSENPNAEILIPWIRPDVITSVNLDDRRIVVDWDPDF